MRPFLLLISFFAGPPTNWCAREEVYQIPKEKDAKSAENSLEAVAIEGAARKLIASMPKEAWRTGELVGNVVGAVEIYKSRDVEIDYEKKGILGKNALMKTIKSELDTFSVKLASDKATQIDLYLVTVTLFVEPQGRELESSDILLRKYLDMKHATKAEKESAVEQLSGKRLREGRLQGKRTSSHSSS